MGSFDFCAECLGSFIVDNLGRTEKDARLPLGFTVSFEMHVKLPRCCGY